MGLIRTPPEWVHIQLMHLYGAIDDEPGIWTAKLCRQLNGLPETLESIIYCGYCEHYANPRKRERAEIFAAIPVFKGFSPPHQLQKPCWQWPLRTVQSRAYRLWDLGFIYGSREQIPDLCQARGWDWATRWYTSDGG